VGAGFGGGACGRGGSSSADSLSSGVVGQWDERDRLDGHIACDKNHQAKAAQRTRQWRVCWRT